MTRCDNVNASTRLVNYSGRTYAFLQLDKKGPRRKFASRSTTASTVSDVLAHADDSTGLDVYDDDDDADDDDGWRPMRRRN